MGCYRNYSGRQGGKKKSERINRPAELAFYQASWFLYPFDQWASIQTSWNHIKVTKRDAQKSQEHFLQQRNDYTMPIHIPEKAQELQTTNWKALNISSKECYKVCPQNANALCLVSSVDSCRRAKIPPCSGNSYPQGIQEKSQIRILIKIRPFWLKRWKEIKNRPKSR